MIKIAGLGGFDNYDWIRMPFQPEYVLGFGNID